MTIFFLMGIVFLVFSGLFLFAPRIIIKLSELGNRMIFADYSYVSHRKLSGAILLVMSVIMFYIGMTL